MNLLRMSTLTMNILVTKMSTRTYLELLTFPTFEERFQYLKLDGVVCHETFGRYRYLNQALYLSDRWRQFRRRILLRDYGHDLACEDHDIFSHPIIHHINPICVEDLLSDNPCVFDPNNVVTVSERTHQALHYGDRKILELAMAERKENDMCPWRR